MNESILLLLHLMHYIRKFNYVLVRCVESASAPLYSLILNNNLKVKGQKWFIYRFMLALQYVVMKL